MLLRGGVRAGRQAYYAGWAASVDDPEATTARISGEVVLLRCVLSMRCGERFRSTEVSASPGSTMFTCTSSAQNPREIPARFAPALSPRAGCPRQRASATAWRDRHEPMPSRRSKRALDFGGKVVVVTGGTKGSWSWDRRFVSWRPALRSSCVVASEPDSLAQALTSAKKLHFVAADVRDADQVAKRSSGYATWTLGRLDTLVNNAGGAPPADTATASAALLGENLPAQPPRPAALSRRRPTP